MKALIKLCLLCAIALFTSLLLFGNQPALAKIDEDRYDGNIFILYASNGSIVPPRRSLADSLNKGMPALLFLYLDDSKDCKQLALVISNLQAYYGRAASFIPVSVDAIPVKSSYSPQEPGYYYEGLVPQTIIIDGDGKVVFKAKGKVKFEDIDDAFRKVFDLLPRSESVELKRRSFNEFNAELVD